MKHLSLVIAFAVLVGCRSLPKDAPPTLSPMTDADALAIINARIAALKTVQASADVTLTGSDGKSVTLDAAVVLAPPSRMRLRAWKLGQGVFDVMLNGDEAWLWIGRDEASGMSRLTRAALQDMVHVIFAPVSTLERDKTGRYGGGYVSGPYAKSRSLKRAYDPKTLALRQVSFGEDSARVTDIRLEDHRIINEQVWPTRIAIASPSGTIDIRFKDVTINEELPSKALMPAARAKRVP